jgi:quercetin 2,3-dioxygenase
MMTIRRSEDRGHANYGWLDTHHSFSFAGYYDPAHMGFGPLRVINDDRIAGGGGFPTHPHSDMEIITYILEGALEHKDTLGNGAVIRRNDVQRMTAGTGIRHSEFNASAVEPVHLLQIWILPERSGLTPGYEQKIFAEGDKRGRLALIASREGRDGSVTIHRDADVYAALLAESDSIAHALRPGRAAWLQVAAGAVIVNGETLREGDGAAIRGGDIELAGTASHSELLLFDMAV